MNDQNSQFHQVPNGNGDSENTYSYVFSSGGTSPAQKPPKKAGKRLAFAITVSALCVVLSLVTGIGGALLAVNFMSSTPHGGETVQDDTTAQEPVLHEDPDSLVDKSLSNASWYGSAGEDVFAPSTVVRQVQDTVVVINATCPSYMGYTESSTGSGVVISADGYILTCNHVVEDAQSMQVTMNSGAVYEATLVGNDAASDLAVIKIDPGEEELIYAEQGCSGDLIVGESVVAIGNPLGLGLTATVGIVSATERTIEMSDGTEMTLIQTDAAINSGNSGGGLFNLDGQLIGVVNAKYSASGVEGLAFAIPIDSAYEVERQLIQYGYVRGVVDHGLTLLEVTNGNLYAAYRQFGITEVGIYIYLSEYSTKLQAMDRIVKINDTAIDSLQALEDVIDACAVGDTITVTVERSGKTVTASLTLREYVPDRLKDQDD